MSNVKKPEPVAWRYWRESRKRFVYLFKEPKVLQRRHQCLITTGQAEAYKDACVQEALENYERTLRNGLRGLLVFDRNSVDLAITDSAAFIRALIPKQ